MNKSPLDRATTWTIDASDPFVGVLTNEDGLVIEMRRIEDGIGWRPKLTAGEPTWHRYGGYGRGFIDRVTESLLHSWSDYVDANNIPREVAPFTVAKAIKAALKAAN